MFSTSTDAEKFQLSDESLYGAAIASLDGHISTKPHARKETDGKDTQDDNPRSSHPGHYRGYETNSPTLLPSPPPLPPLLPPRPRSVTFRHRGQAQSHLFTFCQLTTITSLPLTVRRAEHRRHGQLQQGQYGQQSQRQTQWGTGPQQWAGRGGQPAEFTGPTTPKNHANKCPHNGTPSLAPATTPPNCGSPNPHTAPSVVRLCRDTARTLPTNDVRRL